MSFLQFLAAMALGVSVGVFSLFLGAMLAELIMSPRDFWWRVGKFGELAMRPFGRKGE